MLLIFINKKMSVFKFSFCSSEMLYYNKYTVYPQSLCMEIAAERLIVILEIVPSVNQWQYLRDDCGWKWLISSTDKQKWYKWSWGHFARCYLCLFGGVCVCVCLAMVRTFSLEQMCVYADVECVSTCKYVYALTEFLECCELFTTNWCQVHRNLWSVCKCSFTTSHTFGAQN